MLARLALLRTAAPRAALVAGRSAPCASFSTGDEVAAKEEAPVMPLPNAEEYLLMQNQTVTPWQSRDDLHDHEGFVSGTTPAIVDGEEGKAAGTSAHFVGRTATISRPPPHASQSGTYKFRHWRITFDQQERWTNPLMGWASSADSLQQLDNLRFETKEQAVGFARRQGWNFEVNDENVFQKRDFRGKKDYGDTFLTAYAKNTRAKIGAKLYDYDNDTATGGKSAWVNQARSRYGKQAWSDDGWKAWRSGLKGTA